MFDHQDGDIDIELYDDGGTLLRSSTTVTDNETIYLSDIEGGSYYYMRVAAYGDTAFQEYSLDYSFPVVVSEATISADDLEGESGNEAYRRSFKRCTDIFVQKILRFTQERI